MCQHHEEMKRLLDDLDFHKREVEQAFSEGFHIGYQDGYDLGRAHAQHEMAEAWRLTHQTVQDHARRRTFAEILRNRREVA